MPDARAGEALVAARITPPGCVWKTGEAGLLARGARLRPSRVSSDLVERLKMPLTVAGAAAVSHRVPFQAFFTKAPRSQTGYERPAGVSIERA